MEFVSRIQCLIQGAVVASRVRIAAISFQIKFFFFYKKSLKFNSESFPFQSCLGIFLFPKIGGKLLELVWPSFGPQFCLVFATICTLLCTIFHHVQLMFLCCSQPREVQLSWKIALLQLEEFAMYPGKISSHR